MTDINKIFDNLRYHPENEVVEFKKAENNFDFDDLGAYSGDSRSPIPMISVHSVGDFLYRRQS